MEHAHLVAQLLKEVDGARAAIAASYVRLWRPDRGATGETGEPPAQTQQPLGADASRGEPPSQAGG